MIPVAPPPSGGGHRRRNAILAAALALALLGGGVGWWQLWGDDAPADTAAESPDGAPAGDQEEDQELEQDGQDRGLSREDVPARVLAQLDQPEDITGYALGMWLGADTVTRALPEGITQWTLEGEEIWHYPSNRRRCMAAKDVSDNRIAIMEGARCEHVTVLDLEDGHPLWHFDVEPELEDGGTALQGSIAFTGDTLAVVGSTGGTGYTLEGEPRVLWEPGNNPGCQVTGYGAQNEYIVEVQECAQESGTMTRGIFTVRDAAGDKVWSWEHTGHHEDRQLFVHDVVALDPIVLRVSLDAPGYTGGTPGVLAVYDDQDPVLIDVPGWYQYSWDCHESSRVIDRCDGVVVHDRVMYVESRVRRGEADPDDHMEVTVHAHDLRTGVTRMEWGVDDDLDSHLVPIGVEDGQIILYLQRFWKAGGTEGGSAILTIDAATYDWEVVMRLPEELHTLEQSILTTSSLGKDIGWRDGQLYLSRGDWSPEQVGEPHFAILGL
ncbi:hypothetical protein [Streptomyces bohaiensis]|uniref:hypothetical protein n=1 Tax=Streptomyces bohaiensis TaxID=1431344 RepID=UPI003B78BC0D